jgi:6-phosphogluconolactonase
VADVVLVVSDEPVRAAANAVVEALSAVSHARGPRLAIPGGSAARALGPIRAALTAAGIWPRLRLTWVDERCVPFSAEESNRGAAYRQGLLDPAEPCLAELPLFDANESPDDAVRRVRAALADDFDDGLDVTLLGMGEDGHVASLFVGCADVDGAVTHVSDSPKPPASRISLTRAFLRTARRSILFATGEEKRDALSRLLGGDESLPATGLPGLTLVTDMEITK